MLVVYVVRTGAKDPQAHVNYRGYSGARLATLGVQAAQNVAERLASCGVAPEGVYFAPCPAAWQTAQILAHRLTRPRRELAGTLALADVLPGESGVEFKRRIERFLAKFYESAARGSFIFVVDQAVADALVDAWSPRKTPDETMLSLEKADEHIRVLVRD